MNTLRSVVLAAAVATGGAVGLTAGLVQAQQNPSTGSERGFPSKPIRLIVGFGAGGQPDTLARIVGQKLSESWGQSIVVDNRPAGGGTLASGTAAKAAPDGHTLLWMNFGLSAALQPDPPQDPLKEFAGVAQIGYSVIVLAATPTLGVKSIKDLIALAKAQPGKIILSTSGAGTSSHLSGARFTLAAGIKVVQVAFKGAPEAVVETLAGRTHYFVGAQGNVMAFIKEGKLVPLAVFTPQRSPSLPDVPALAETLSEFKRPETSLGLLAPANTPRAIVNQINREIVRVLELPDVRERMHIMGFFPASSTPEEYEKIVRSQIANLSKLARETGLRPK